MGKMSAYQIDLQFYKFRKTTVINILLKGSVKSMRDKNI